MAKPVRDKLRMREVRGSDLAEFVRRLRKLGFNLEQRWQRQYRVAGSPYKYQRTYWRLVNGRQKVLFKISRHGYTLAVWLNNKPTLRIVGVTPGQLELPFLRYFNQQEPLCLRRLGKQPRKIRRWLRKNPQSRQAALIHRFIKPAASRARSPRQLNAAAKPQNTK